LQDPSDLAQATCLHDASWREDWARWIAAAMPGRAIDLRGPVFSLYSLAVEEARNGAGVLIGHEPLVRAQLASGALVAPFPTRVTLDRRMSIALARPAAAGSALHDIVEALTRGDVA
jgi:LysR family glycine cleavage system transcriptional activator